MAERATMAELQEFANKVRAAGGGNPIDALMPSVPEDETQCLIARNLNFNCAVSGAEGVEDPIDGTSDWSMWLTTKELRDDIADALELTKCFKNEYNDLGRIVEYYGVLLPQEIGQVAADFDAAGEALFRLNNKVEWARDFGCDRDERVSVSKLARKEWDKLSDEDRGFIADFLPYIEEAETEALRLASIVNEDGTIVI